MSRNRFNQRLTFFLGAFLFFLASSSFQQALASSHDKGKDHVDSSRVSGHLSEPVAIEAIEDAVAGDADARQAGTLALDLLQHPAFEAALAGVVGDKEQPLDERLRFWGRLDQLKTGLEAEMARPAPSQNIAALSAALFDHVAGNAAMSEDIRADALARRDAAFSAAALAPSGALPVEEPLDFKAGMTEVRSLNALADSLHRNPLTFPQMIERGIAVVDDKPVYRNGGTAPQDEKDENLALRRVYLPAAQTGMYVPKNWEQLNAETVGVAGWFPGIGGKFSHALTMATAGVAFYTGVPVVDDRGEKRNLSLFPYLVDATLGGMAKGVPRYFGSPEGTTAVARLATAVAKAMFVDAKAKGILARASAQAKAAEARSKGLSEADVQAIYAQLKADFPAVVFNLIRSQVNAAARAARAKGGSLTWDDVEASVVGAQVGTISRGIMERAESKDEAKAKVKSEAQAIRAQAQSDVRDILARAKSKIQGSPEPALGTGGGLAGTEIAAIHEEARAQLAALSADSVPAFGFGRSQGGLIVLQAAAENKDFAGVIAVNPTNPDLMEESTSPQVIKSLISRLIARVWGVALHFVPMYDVLTRPSQVPVLLKLSTKDEQYPHPAYTRSLEAFVDAQPGERQVIVYEDPPERHEHDLLRKGDDAAAMVFYEGVVARTARFVAETLWPEAFAPQTTRVRRVR